MYSSVSLWISHSLKRPPSRRHCHHLHFHLLDSTRKYFSFLQWSLKKLQQYICYLSRVKHDSSSKKDFNEKRVLTLLKCNKLKAKTQPRWHSLTRFGELQLNMLQPILHLERNSINTATCNKEGGFITGVYYFFTLCGEFVWARSS